MYVRGAGDGVEHLVATYGEFESHRWVQADEVSRIVGAGEIWNSVRRRLDCIALGKRYGGRKLHCGGGGG